MKLLIRFLILVFGMVFCTVANAAELRLAVTTSFNNSGLADVLLPKIKHDLGIDVHLLVVGTGQALRLGRGGDVDAILVHSKQAEEQFVQEGWGTHRTELMYNDFVLVGPKGDPAGIGTQKTAKEALKSIMSAKSAFISRGDDSGTHKKEISLWISTGLDPASFSPQWYRSVGAGMGAALNTASAMNAYILTDRASWLKFANKGDLKLLFFGDPGLFNQYSYLPINPAKHPHVQHQLARTLEQWLTTPQAQQIIGDYKIDGEVLFTPNAKIGTQK